LNVGTECSRNYNKEPRCVLVWHRMFEALLAGRPLQGIRTTEWQLRAEAAT
jgi:hypothetical protein